jgi:hypothetical protein
VHHNIEKKLWLLDGQPRLDLYRRILARADDGLAQGGAKGAMSKGWAWLGRGAGLTGARSSRQALAASVKPPSQPGAPSVFMVSFMSPGGTDFEPNLR